MSRKYSINLSCGQTDLYPSALAEMSKQLHTPIYYPPYYDLELACIERLQQMLHTTHDVLMLTGTATYGEEAAMLSILEPGDRVLTVNTGVFGQVLTDLARVVGAEPMEIKLPAGHSVSPDQIQAALRHDPRIRMVAVVQVETSQGTTNPVDAIGRMLQQEFPDTLYLVDAVSALAATEIRVDEWGIDLCCTSSQKAANAPQGLAIVSVSPRAWRAIEGRRTPIPSLCLDLLTWRHYHASVRQARTQWSEEDAGNPAVSHYKAAHGPSLSYVLVKALKAALDEIFEEGPESVFRRHQVASRALREGVRAMGLQTLATEENAAPDATCVVVPGDWFDVKRFMRIMWEDFGIATAGGSPSRKVGGYVGFRVGTMGLAAAPGPVFAFLNALEQVLPRMGYAVKVGAALPAAQAIFAAGE